MTLAQFQTLAERFIEDSPHFSPSMIRNVRQAITLFIADCTAANRRASVKSVYQWTENMSKAGYEISTIHLYRSLINNLCRWAIAKGALVATLVEPIRGLPKAPNIKVERIITPEEYRRLLVYHYDAEMIWWPELIRLGWETGLRMGDCSMLAISEVDFELGAICKVAAKNRRFGKKLELPISAELLALIRARLQTALIEEEETLSLKPWQEKYVWPRAAFQYHHLRQWNSDQFQEFARACQIKCPCFHALRHARVTTLLAAGASTAVVRGITGHSLANLQRYADHISLATKRAACEAAERKANLV